MLVTLEGYLDRGLGMISSKDDFGRLQVINVVEICRNVLPEGRGD